MSKRITIFKKALGLNNAVDPTRIKHSFDSGETELATAFNVDIDVAGRVSMRRGLTATARTEASHSLFCDGGECLFISSTALYRLNADYSRTGVRSAMTSGARLRCTQVANKIYYTNGYQIGYVQDGTSYVWEASDYVGPTTHRRFSDPPVGSIVEFLSSRIYMAKDDVLWYSEPFAYGWFDLTRNFAQMGSRIRMVRSVKTGLYVGTDKEVIFVGGTDPSQFTYDVVSKSPAVEYTDVKIAGAKFADGSQAGQLAMWTAQDGIYVGMPDGNVMNVTRDKLIYPSSQLGCAVFKDNKYLTLIQ